MILLAIFVRTSTGPPWFWPIIGACAGVYLFYSGFRLLQRKRLILNTPQSKVRSAAMGLVEVSGLATGPYSLLAPITARPCYYYRTMVWQWERQGKNNTWVKKVDESLHVPFYLDDNTGRVLVNPQGAELDIHCDFKEEFGRSIFSREIVPDNITNFLLMHNIDSDKKIKVEEYCLKPKNALFVLGTLAHNPGLVVSGSAVQTIHGTGFQSSGNFGGLSLSLGTSLFSGALAGSASASLVATSLPVHPVLDKVKQEQIAAAMVKAGITHPAAWAAVGVSPVAAVTSAARQPATGTAAAPAPAIEQFDLHPAAVLMKGPRNLPFLISWKSQREIVKSLGWKSGLMIWGGPALTLLSVYFIALQFGWL